MSNTTSSNSSTLTGKQQKFVDSYLGAARFNATEAARLAGYAGSDHTLHVVGYENLRKPEIAEAVKARVNEYAMSAEEVLAELSAIARSNAGEVLTVPEVGRAYFDFRKAEQNGKLGLIKKLSYTEHGPSVELWDKQAALVQLGKVYGLFVEKHEITGKDGGPIVVKILRGVSMDEL